MNWLKELGRRLFYLGRQTDFNRELEDEMQFHIEARADELEQTGMPRTHALAQAHREFGSGVHAGAHALRLADSLVGRPAVGCAVRAARFKAESRICSGSDIFAGAWYWREHDDVQPDDGVSVQPALVPEP
jgi:hypothetical protein